MAEDVLARLAREGAVIERLVADSRAAGPGAAFFAWPGTRTDGRRYIPEAIGRGCAAVLWEPEGFAWDPAWRVPNAPVRGLRERAGDLAHAFYGRPSEALWVCGVTGTNGKTTCSQWLAAALAAAGERAGVIGTLGAGFPGSLAPLAHTTPDALEVHALLAQLRRAGARAVAMEVSSHALDQGRVNGVRFACALFTNLTHDHLDYHGSLRAYAQAKARLFETPGLACAVLNLDDAFGVELAARLGARGVRTIGYALERGALVPGSVREWILGAPAGEAAFAIESSWGDARVAFAHLGRHNVANALGVLGCLLARGLPFADAVRLIERLPSVPGRLERVGAGAGPLVFVDYAHTPDALDKVLAALRPLAQARGGRLVAVFGAGGERDPAKRPAMGAAAARHADRIVLTSDNPRGEDPRAIIAAIARGIERAHEVEPDRARAIRRAIAEAAAADVVLIAGKGHERTQEIAGRRLPFSDVAEAEAALAARGER
ncbi:MAG: UDP-N-acetylmuramoyl-L-alanyl-D-glutamate--2,6-diaminopimelate ligase [Burkholderiales bacterium]|nr:UDP-N-acetylmuramoyl-L-alanyl-D-glutamate--2,6-diaminopimelate ligase [Burkholderiales bacterium]